MSVASAPNFSADGSNSNQTVIHIALSYGLGLLVTAWTLYRVSGGLFNPAVTLGLVLTGNIPWLRGLIFMPTQIVAAMSAAAVASAIIPGDIAVVQTTLGNGVSVSQGLFIEMVSCALTTRAHSRTDHYLVLDLLADLHNPHARGGKIQSHLYRSDRYWHGAIRDTDRRSLLHRRVAESSSIFRALCGRYQLSRLSLE